MAAPVGTSEPISVGSMESFRGKSSSSVGSWLMYLMTMGRPLLATMVGPSRTGSCPGWP